MLNSKKILSILILTTLLLTCSCSNNANKLNDDSQENVEDSIDNSEKTSDDIKDDVTNVEIAAADTEYKAKPVSSCNEIEIKNAEGINQDAVKDSNDRPIILYPKEELLNDFNELPKDEFPRGTWTINQLSEKFGIPKDMRACGIDGYDVVFVQVAYANFSVEFQFEYITHFSFFTESIVTQLYPAQIYQLSDKDKDLEMEIYAIFTSDDKAILPRGIKIGQSTKEQVLAAYPKDTATEYISEDLNKVWYEYIFYSETDSEPLDEDYAGSIGYEFDKNNVLEQISIAWYYQDL